MNRLKKLMALLLVGALVLCLALSISSCGGDEGNGVNGEGVGGSGEQGNGGSEGGSGEPCNHFDLTGDGKCDACGEEYEEPFSEFELTVTAKDEEGNVLPDVAVIVYDSGYMIDSAQADKDGRAVFTLPIGSYMITLSDLPEYWTAGMKNVEGDEKQVSVSVIATDNTPDGSLLKPFFVGDEAQEFTVPALTSHNFFIKGMNRTLKVYGEGFKVYCEDKEYTEIEDGVMSVFIVGTDDPYSNTPFSVENLTDAPITVTVHFESAPGSRANPIKAELDTPYSPDIAKESSVYYSYTAEASGVLTVSSDDVKNNMMLYNLTSLNVTEFTNGSSSVSIEVDAGDVVLVTVSHSDSSPTHAVKFTLSMLLGESYSEQ